MIIFSIAPKENTVYNRIKETKICYEKRFIRKQNKSAGK